MARSLPLEILEQIFSYHPESLTAYACVCRQWQVAAEAFTFADLHIDSASLEDFRRIVASPHSVSRYFYIRSLYFKIILPDYSVAARSQYENQDDRDGNNKVFTQAIKGLFESLSSWPNYDGYEVLLQIYAKSPSDWQSEEDWVTRRARQQRGHAFPEQELLHRRYESSYLQLMEKVALPDVKCITSLKVMGCDALRNIAPGAVSVMVIHLPRLETINAKLRDKEKKATEMTDSLGSDFSVISWPRSLRHLQLRYEAKPPYSENCSTPLTTGPNSVCLSLYQLTQQLESVDLFQIMISPESFWPVDASNTTPFWPTLRKFVASCTYAPADGYSPLNGCLKLDKDSSPVSQHDSVEASDNQEQSQFRQLLIKNMDEVFLAAGRAAQHMPKLSLMEIDIGTFFLPDSRYSFMYDASSGTATWTTSSEFCISNEVRDAWDIAAQGHGHGHCQICMEVLSADSSLSP
ncbi:uncharacterized protein N7479_010344 [Penicillium vulpinum]|uniref:Uncharacterized protein n=1 Tax=Penicillium vulpinum TaxID=29845 RepID=A0A1V6S9M9_9EURO|nr:uncharacterized protein N7479_010344 [Penicillium vulpinum]KAJ5951931.1 hypothetical protein N7479_010344 [Penicillium vulpinum]OQE10313.1 hypothetical protein PENVUL_c004G00958 [Penicillium vulpinum]